MDAPHRLHGLRPVRISTAVMACCSLAAAPAPGADSEPPTIARPAAEIRESLIVTASRDEEPLGEAISIVTVVPTRELRTSPTLVLDDQLRQVPGFSLFRRSSSLTSHPTTQGVSLRGIAPSGTSRTLVLFDGMPLNDPFGGWVYWNRLPSLSLESVEVSRGATSALYGSSALGGVVQLLPRGPEEAALDLSLRVGERENRGAEAFSAGHGERWGHTLSGGVLHSGGHFLLRPRDRGAVDRPADLVHGSLVGRLHRDRFHVGAQLFREERGNGTVLQENSTRIVQLETGMDGPSWQWNLHWQDQEFDSTFSRVLAGRDEEILTAEQFFPSRGMGGSVTWHPGEGWLTGLDLRRSEWESEAQDLTGLFVQKDLATGPRVRWLLGGRIDVWENANTETSFNPRAGLVYQASPEATLRASIYRGFRAPTLNELYRPFRVGNVETLANPELDEERLVGGEVGIDLAPRQNLLLRLNTFWNELDGSVGNVTLEANADGTLRRRENLGAVRVAGGEAEAVVSWEHWQVRLAYLYSDSEVKATGRVLPQAPRNSGSFRIERRGLLTTVLQGRYLGEQYEDDLNTLSLEPGYVLDLYLDYPLRSNLTVSLAIENVLDERLEVGSLPEPRIGSPRILHLGLRLSG